MPGGPGKINEYYNSLTPEEKRELHLKAINGCNETRRRKKLLREIALQINDAKASKESIGLLTQLGVTDPEMQTNAALIVGAVFQAILDGDMRALQEWKEWIGENTRGESDGNGELANLIDGLKQ